jgi:hypothetical protein
MITAPLLLPRSRKHAYIQILSCLLLFYIYPQLVPDWYYFPLTILTVALLSAPSRAQLRGALTRDTALSALSGSFIATRRGSCILANALSHFRWKARETLAVCAGELVILAGAWNDVTRYYVARICSRAAAIAHNLQKVYTLACTILESVLSILKWITRVFVGMLRGIYLSNYELPKISLPPIRISSIRYIVASLLSIILTPFVHLTRQTKQLIWLLVMVGHFLSFTLGLTIVFPCLCVYGLVVACMHQTIMQGITPLSMRVLGSLSW